MKPVLRTLALFTCATPAIAVAADGTWNGTTNTNWSTAGNWASSIIPGSGDNLTIASTTTNGLTLDGTTSRTIGTLKFGADGLRATNFTLNTQTANTLTINGGIVAGGSFATTPTALTMKGNFIVANAQTWSVGGSASHSTDQGIFVREVTTGATNRGSLTLNANLTKTGAGQLVMAAIDLTGSGNLIVDSGSLKLNAGASQPLVVGGTGNITMNGSSVLSVYKNSGTMSISRAIVMNGTSSLVTKNSTCDIASAITFNGTHSLDAGVTTNLTGGWSGAGTVNRTGTGSINVTGSTTGFTGTLNFGAGTSVLSGAFGGNIGSTGGTNSVGGGVTGLLTSSGGTTTVNGNVGGAINTTGGITTVTGNAGGNVVVNGGTLNLGGSSVSGTLSLGATGTLGGEVISTGAMDLNGGTFSVNPVTPGTLATLGNLTLTGVNSVTLAANPVSTAPFAILTYAGSLTGGASNLSLVGGSTSYRSPTFNADTLGVITLAVSSEARTWAGGASWDVNTSANWTGGDTKFLQLDSVTFTNAGAGAVNLEGTLIPSSIAINSNTDYSFTSTTGGLIGGATGLTKSGTGTVTLAGANTFTGNITISGGTLRPAATQSLGGNGKTITITAGGALDTNGVLNTSRDYDTVIAGNGPSGTGAIVNSSATGQQAGFRSITLSDDATIGGVNRWDVRPIVAGTAFVDLNGKTLTKSGANTIALVDGTMTDDGSVVVSGGTLSITRMVVGGAGSVSVGTGATLKFENNTTGSFNKALAVDGGTVQSVGNAYTIAPSVTVSNTATFLCDVNLTINGTVGGLGAVAKTGAGTLILAGDATHTGGTTVSTGILQVGNSATAGSISGTITNSAGLVFDRSDASSFSGSISGAGTVTKQGAGVLTLSGASLFTGAATLNAGGIRLDGGNDRLPVTTVLTLANTAGAALDLNGRNQELRNLIGGGTTGGNVVNTGTGTSVLTMRPTGSDSVAFAGVIGGDIRVVVAGNKTGPSFTAPRQRLAGTANTYTGGTLVDGGTLMVRVDESLGAIPSSFDPDNITLQNNGTLLNETDPPFALSVHANRGITLGTGGGALVAGFNTTVTVNGVISGDAGNTLTIMPNNGTMVLTGNNTYAGNTVLQPTTGGSNVARLQIGNGGTSGTLGAGNVTNDGILTFNRSDASSYGGDISGVGTLVKQGAGSLTLGGDSTYTGTTTVSAGFLYVNGSLGNTAVSIADGATLGGSGSISGGVTAAAAGSHIAPGNSPDTLSVGTLDLSNGAVMDFELGSVSDLIAVAGGLAASAGVIDFRFADSGGFANGVTYNLITFASSSGLDYSDLTASVVPDGYMLDTDFGTGGWQINSDSLQVRFVPEPSSAWLVLGGSLGLALRRRRER
ncbi:MAG: autotransporter-associated beta strand repeat-containing protein [Verrucomicrobia bacterium]|nr:autotransporter-associated beta strand repeat-containing protein [Verrucomicrobiota bacterium]